MLQLHEVHAFYGQIHALKGVALRVDAGEIVTLIGSNGAGKSTLLRTISGLVRLRRGQILWQSQPIERLAPHAIVGLGISHAPEGRRVFSRLTVQENLELGAYLRPAREARQDLERVLALFPRLQERLRQRAGTLSGGEQQMLTIGRALMARPRLLLLDEPSMGLSPLLVEVIFRVIRDIHAQGTAVLLVEQNALAALSIAQRGYVLQSGEIVLEGPAGVLLEDPAVQRAYLGEAVGVQG
ncbi:MAG: ABC transporter ATP-binding protein [Chloroflexi bacterium]|nr:ABC transporter ATP-binding protein [Chloroflexota bacterium]